MREEGSRQMMRALSFLVGILLWSSRGVVFGATAVTPWGPMGDIEAGARKEGRLVIYAAPGHVNRNAEQAISEVFKEKSGVVIDWTALSARDLAPRVMAEQRTKQYVADIGMSGIAGNYVALKPRGFVVQILAPSTFERGVWRLDPASAFPKDRDWLFINMPLRPSFFVNTNMVKPEEEPMSYQDLLLPKWKGKIVLQIPWTGGTGSGWFRAVYSKLGVDTMKALAKQVALVPNVSDSADAVARGRFPIGIAPETTRARELVLEGAPVKLVHPKEGSHMGVNGVELLANAPHPNAAKLFLHWFYTREGQAVYAKNHLTISVRKDISQEYLPPELRYQEGAPFLMAPAEDFSIERNEELTKLAKEIFDIGR